MSTLETGLAAAVPVIGRCTVCKRPVRVEIPAEVAARFGLRLAGAIGYAMRAAGIGPVSCGCRKGVRCAENAHGLPECGDSWCDGHDSPVKFSAVKVVYKAEVTCSGSCWGAKSSSCTCSCRGKNHGGMWALGRGF